MIRSAMENPAGDPLEFPLSVREALQVGARILAREDVESPRLDAEVLLAAVKGWGKEQLYLNHENRLDKENRRIFQSHLRRRARREPIAYITGHREFWSLDFLVNPDVLVPRPETEGIVESALGLMAAAAHQKFRLLDLGTGSGAIAVSLAKERTDIELWATDRSAAALKVARLNAERNGVSERVHFDRGDLFSPIEEYKGFFHGIVANPPYIRSGDLPNLAPEIRWEPELALDGGPDGLDLYRPIIDQAPSYLAQGGFVVLEIGMEMGKDVCRLLKKFACYTEGTVRQDHADRDRVVSARITHRPEAPRQGV
jgi:release factor glutamine methyltransferase